MAGSSDNTDEGIVGINITPLVDVALVLLIIFIVTAKNIVSQTIIPLDLPKASNSVTGQTQDILDIELSPIGELVVDKTKYGVNKDDEVLRVANERQAALRAQNKALPEGQKPRELRVVIRADAKVNHGRVIHVIDLLKEAKVTKIAFGVYPGQLTGPALPPTPNPAPTK